MHLLGFRFLLRRLAVNAFLLLISEWLEERLWLMVVIYARKLRNLVIIFSFDVQRLMNCGR